MISQVKHSSLSKGFPKTLQKEYDQKHFFSTQGKTSRGKLKHKRKKALSVIILAKMFHFP